MLTRDTSHFEMSPLNEYALANTPLISATLDTSHSAIEPYGPLRQSPLVGENLRHLSTASLSSALDQSAKVVVHAVRDIDPEDPVNMFLLLAFELTQLAPQSFWLNDAA